RPCASSRSRWAWSRRKRPRWKAPKRSLAPRPQSRKPPNRADGFVDLGGGVTRRAPPPGDDFVPRDVDAPALGDKVTAPPAVHALELPAWYPAWARELADLYFSGTTCLFVLHGNVHDLIRRPDGEGFTYCNLAEFLATQLFGAWDVVLDYDLAR